MVQESQAVAVLQEAKETFIGRIFSFVGSGIFFISSFIVTVVAFKTYIRLSQTSTS
ncbi:hypothetical protein M3215_02405 [Bacillus cytotoxicus]|uniref:Uncharacterized protein n=1 Tax=Bacillus cytotoxicus TaxID=580165 RepID=A0ACC6A224_9BACI|nr:hypothetical protein [Bacillus cytotoxicus]